MKFPFLATTPPICPPGLLTLARGLGPPQRMALVNAGAATPLIGLREAVEAGLAEPILIGDARAIHAAADQIGWDIRDFRLIASTEDDAAAVAAALAVAGDADSIMKGQIHSSTFLKGLLPSAAGSARQG